MNSNLALNSSNQKPPIHLQRQIVVDVDGVEMTVNHVYSGSGELRDLYSAFLERKIANF